MDLVAFARLDRERDPGVARGVERDAGTADRARLGHLATEGEHGVDRRRGAQGGRAVADNVRGRPREVCGPLIVDHDRRPVRVAGLQVEVVRRDRTERNVHSLGRQRGSK